MGKTTKKDNTGCIGFGYGGCLMKSKVKLFTLESNDPSDLLKEHREYFGGEKYLMKYTLVDNPEKIKNICLDKLQKKNIDVYGDMVESYITNATEFLKGVVEEIMGDDFKVKFKYCGKPLKGGSKKTKSDDESGNDKKKTKKSKKESSDDKSEDEKKPVNKSKAKSNVDSSDNESDDEKPAKKTKARVKKPSKKEKSESESESESDSE